MQAFIEIHRLGGQRLLVGVEAIDVVEEVNERDQQTGCLVTVRGAEAIHIAETYREVVHLINVVGGGA